MSTSFAFAADPVELSHAVFRNADELRGRRRRILRVGLLLGFLLLAGFFFFSLLADWHFQEVWRYETAGLLGAGVGTAELLSRYRDAPSFVVLSPPGVGYVLINAAASTGAMGLILSFDWKFGANGGAAAATQVLVAGFGSMALFRSSLLTVKAGGDDIGIGPSSVLSIMMAASDRSADRLRAAERARQVHEIMKDVSYAKAFEALPTVAVALMQNLSSADIAALNAELEGLKTKNLPDDTKALLLGLKITNVVSTAVLAAAKDSLGESILSDEALAGPDTGEADDHVPGNGKTPAEHPVDIDLEAGRETAASPGLPQTPQTPDGKGSGD